jgi:hypothetical protein
MANINDNRVNLTLTPAQLTTVSTAISSLNSTLSMLLALTDDERASLLGINVDNKQFVDETLEEMTNNGAILPTYLNVQNLQKDVQLFEQLDGLHSQLMNVVQKISDTRRLAGHESYNMSLAVYKMYEAATQMGIPNARQSYDRLKQRFQQSSGSSSQNTGPSPQTTA